MSSDRPPMNWDAAERDALDAVAAMPPRLRCAAARSGTTATVNGAAWEAHNSATCPCFDAQPAAAAVPVEPDGRRGPVEMVADLERSLTRSADKVAALIAAVENDGLPVDRRLVGYEQGLRRGASEVGSLAGPIAAARPSAPPTPVPPPPNCAEPACDEYAIYGQHCNAHKRLPPPAAPPTPPSTPNEYDDSDGVRSEDAVREQTATGDLHRGRRAP